MTTAKALKFDSVPGNIGVEGLVDDDISTSQLPHYMLAMLR